jgi:hypothetical protein
MPAKMCKMLAQIQNPNYRRNNMDPFTIASIAAGAVKILGPYFKIGGEKLAGKIAEEGFAERGKIWETIKGLFLGDDLTTLNLLEKYPESKEMQAEVRTKLEEKLTANPDVAALLQELLKKIPVSQINQNTMTVTGNNNQTVQGNSGSVSINSSGRFAKDEEETN